MNLKPQRNCHRPHQFIRKPVDQGILLLAAPRCARTLHLLPGPDLIPGGHVGPALGPPDPSRGRSSLTSYSFGRLKQPNEGATLGQFKPAALDCVADSGAELRMTLAALQERNERRVDPLDVDRPS